MCEYCEEIKQAKTLQDVSFNTYKDYYKTLPGEDNEDSCFVMSLDVFSGRHRVDACIADGDSVVYYPKYCPECGRKL